MKSRKKWRRKSSHPVNDEAAVRAIVDSKAINGAGGLFELGVVVANCGVITEAA